MRIHSPGRCAWDARNLKTFLHVLTQAQGQLLVVPSERPGHIHTRVQDSHQAPASGRSGTKTVSHLRPLFHPSLRRSRCGPFLRKRAHKPRSVNHLRPPSGAGFAPLPCLLRSLPVRSSRAISFRFHAWLCRPSAAAWGSHTFSTPVSAALSIRSVGHLDGLPELPDIMKANADYRPGGSLKPGRCKKNDKTKPISPQPEQNQGGT